MATSRYKDFRTVKSFVGDPRRLETFPAITKQSLSIIPHTVITYKETDRLDYLAEGFLGHPSYWWAICLMNDLENPFSYNLLPGKLLKVPNDIENIISLIQSKRTGK